MTRLSLVVVAALLLSLCGFASAKDRGFASAIEWSPDGETIAIASDKGVWFFDNQFNELGFIELWQDMLFMRSPRSLSWNADGDLVAVAFPKYYDSEHPVLIIDVTRFEVIAEHDVLALWTQLVWHPEENLIAADNFGGETFVLDALTGEEVFYFQEKETDRRPRLYTNSTMGLCWFSQSVLAIITGQQTYIVDVELDEILQSFYIRSDLYPPACEGKHKIIAAQEGVFNVDPGAYSERFKSWNDNNEIDFVKRIFPYSSAPLVRERLPGSEDHKISPDGSKVAYNQEGCRISVFDTNDGTWLAVMRAGVYFVQFQWPPYEDSLAWHPDGSRLAAVGQFGGVRVWDGETYELLQQYDGFESGYGEIGEALNQIYSEEAMRRIERLKKRCIAELDSELARKQSTLISG